MCSSVCVCVEVRMLLQHMYLSSITIKCVCFSCHNSFRNPTQLALMHRIGKDLYFASRRRSQVSTTAISMLPTHALGEISTIAIYLFVFIYDLQCYCDAFTHTRAHTYTHAHFTLEIIATNLLLSTYWLFQRLEDGRPETYGTI